MKTIAMTLKFLSLTNRKFYCCALFFLSGFPALLYQLIWQRSLFAIFGMNIESVTMVVSAFMLGLGLGSLFGGWLSRIASRYLLVCFGLGELIIGIFGYYSLALFDRVGEYTLQISGWRTLVVIFTIICLPTLLMGATLPLLTTYLVRRVNHVGESVGLLYFANTMGSAIACLLAATWFMLSFGQSGTLSIAIVINFSIGIAALFYRFQEKLLIPRSQENIAHQITDKSLLSLGMISSLFLAALIGAIALAYEILWVRLYSLITGGSATVFAFVLTYYLTGIACGALASQYYFSQRSHYQPLWILFIIMLTMSLLGFLLIPATAATYWQQIPFNTLAWIGIIATLFGVSFPLLAQSSLKLDDKVGMKLSYLYFSNIIGATLGSFLTGFVLMDYYSMSQIAVILSYAGLLIAIVILYLIKNLSFKKRAGSVIVLLMLGIFFWFSSGSFYQNIHTKLEFKHQIQFQGDQNLFVKILENKSGIITVTKSGLVFGTGAFDGYINTTDFSNNNWIVRAYAVSLFHPNPKEVLLIGASTGAWAQVLANHPQVKKLTIIEINPGYLKIIRQYPPVASLLTNPKVEIVIDDARRWLRHHPERKFDLIVENVWHWREHMSSLLSVEFLQMIRHALNKQGVFYYNGTFSKEVHHTAITVFPYVWRLYNFIVVSDSPIILNKTRWRKVLQSYSIDGKPVFDLTKFSDKKMLDQIISFNDAQTRMPRTQAGVSLPLEDRNTLLRHSAKARIITDDNMGTEWNN